MKRQLTGMVLVLGCALLACKMLKKDEPAVDAAVAEPTPVPEAAPAEEASTTAATEDASTTTPDTPATANTNVVVQPKKDAGTAPKDAGTAPPKDAGTAPPVDAGTAAPKDAGGTNPKTQCQTLCNTGYASCLLTMVKKNVTAAKCKADFDACNAKCK
jgi:hypothetical protein